MIKRIKMNKIISSILLTIMCCFMLTGCVDEPKRVTPVEDDTARFQYIGQDEVNWNSHGESADVVQYYVDNETSIVYIVIINRAGNGTWAGFTPMVDTDGTYVTYDEFKNAED